MSRFNRSEAIANRGLSHGAHVRAALARHDKRKRVERYKERGAAVICILIYVCIPLAVVTAAIFN